MSYRYTPDKHDIVCVQTRCLRTKAEKYLLKNNGDLIKSVIDITKNSDKLI